MKKILLQKIICALLILTVVFSTVGLPFPQKAEAQLATLDTATFSQSLLNVINTTGSAIVDYSLELKAYVLDTLATTLVKILIRQITASVVNWINSGFQGSPSFITNPAGFFIDVADQVTGEFLSEVGGPLTQLCSGFSIDIRLALSFKYHPKTNQKYSCTLGQIIAKNAGVASKAQQDYLKASGQKQLDTSSTALDRSTINGASMSGFMAGDFKQGGLPGFVSLTTSPSNNPYSAFLEADSELGIRVNGRQIAKDKEVSNGKGFLSWRNPKCSADVKAHNTQVAKNLEESPDSEYLRENDNAANSEDSPDAGYIQEVQGETNTLQSTSDCPIETPGSTIVSSLEDNVNGPLHELQLVDSINQIVNALAAQLVNTVLQGGLKAVSGTSPSDSTSYLNRIQAEADSAATPQFKHLQSTLLDKVEKAIDSVFDYKTNKDQSLNTALEAKQAYDAAKACYAGKITNSEPSLDPSQVAAAQAKIANIEDDIDADVTPLVSHLQEEATAVDLQYDDLIKMRSDITNAKTMSDLSAPSDKLSGMFESESVVTAKDIADSKTELAETKTKVAPLKAAAARETQECEVFPHNN
jgi:hypothetical protein